MKALAVTLTALTILASACSGDSSDMSRDERLKLSLQQVNESLAKQGTKPGEDTDSLKRLKAQLEEELGKR